MYFLNLILVLLKRIRKSILACYDIFLKIIKGFAKHDGELSTCALAFYLLISFVPASLVVISLLSFLFDSQSMLDFYADHVKLQLPTIDTERLTSIIDRLFYSNRHLAFIWIPFLFWWASFIFDIFERIVERAFRIRKNRKYWKTKLRHFAIILVLALVVLLFSTLSNAFNLMRTLPFIEFVENQIIHPESFIAFIYSIKELSYLYGSMSNILINSIFLFTIYKLLPPKKLDNKSLIKGTLLVTVIYEIVKILFSRYITQINDYSSIFGSLSTIVVFMIWIWFACAIFVLGAEACYVFYKKSKANKKSNQLSHQGPN